MSLQENLAIARAIGYKPPAVPDVAFDFEQVYRNRPVVLAPMEDVTDATFRRLCRSLGATVAMTEFVNVDGLLKGTKEARKKLNLLPDDVLTGIQIYGSDPEKLAQAAVIAESAQPFFVDVNCGCWIPKIARRGAGAGWLRDPAAMVAMAKLVVSQVSLPVTIKTRIGYGPESHMPIVDLAQRLEDVGVRALTIHCRTAQMAHNGAADWSWAAKAQDKVKIPVIVNGDVRSAEDAVRAIDETGCAGVMVGRRAIEHPWIFREIAAGFKGQTPIPPTAQERFELCRKQLHINVAERGPSGVRTTRRHFRGYLHDLPDAESLRQKLNGSDSLDECLTLLGHAEAALVANPAT